MTWKDSLINLPSEIDCAQNSSSSKDLQQFQTIIPLLLDPKFEIHVRSRSLWGTSSTNCSVSSAFACLEFQCQYSTLARNVFKAASQICILYFLHLIFAVACFTCSQCQGWTKHTCQRKRESRDVAWMAGLVHWKWLTVTEGTKKFIANMSVTQKTHAKILRLERGLWSDRWLLK